MSKNILWAIKTCTTVLTFKNLNFISTKSECI